MRRVRAHPLRLIQWRIAVRSLEELRAVLIERLQERSEEVAGLVLSRVREVDADPVRDRAPELAQGLRDTVAAALAHTLEVIAVGERWSGVVPAAALAQVRRSARGGVPLNTVL